MTDDVTGTGRRGFLRLAGGAAGVGIGIPALTGRAAAQTLTWERKFDYEDQPSSINDVAVTRDGGYVTAGFVTPNIQEANAWVAKLDDDGDVEWSRTYDADPDDEYDNDYGNAVAELPDGYVVAGATGDPDSVRVLRLDAAGDVLRSRRFDRTETSGDRGVDVVAVSDGGAPDGYAVLASSFEDGDGDGDGDAWLLRLDADLNVRWERTYGANASLNPVGLVRTAAGGYAVAATATTEGVGSLWLGRTDDCGDLCWSRTYADADGSTQAAGVAERRRDGRTAGYALVGTTRSASGWALRGVTTAPDGSVRAARTFDTGRYANGEDVVATDDGYAFLATASPQPEDVSFYLVATGDGLETRWNEYYGRSQSYDHIEEAAALTYADGEYGLAGAYLSGGDFDTADGYVVNVVEDA